METFWELSACALRARWTVRRCSIVQPEQSRTSNKASVRLSRGRMQASSLVPLQLSYFPIHLELDKQGADCRIRCREVLAIRCAELDVTLGCQLVFGIGQRLSH